MLEYIKRRQKQLEAKRQREAELEAKKEAARIAKIKEEARKKEEAIARKKLLLEQQEAERLHQKHLQAKEKVTEDKWNEQLDTLLGQIDRKKQEKKKLEEMEDLKSSGYYDMLSNRQRININDSDLEDLYG